MAEVLDRRYVWTQVLQSVVFAITGAFSGMKCVGIARRKIDPQERRFWLTCGGIAFGYGTIFTMHFEAMTALQIQYDHQWNHVDFSVALILLSMPLACISCTIALVSLDREYYHWTDPLRDWKSLCTGGAAFAVGVGLMHYGGVISMCGPFEMKFDYYLVGTTVLLAIVLCTVGLGLSMTARGMYQRILAAIVVGGAVTLVHYVGVINVRFEAASSFRCMSDDDFLGASVAANRLGNIVTCVATLGNFIIQVVVPFHENRILREMVRGMHEQSSRKYHAAASGKTNVIDIVTQMSHSQSMESPHGEARRGLVAATPGGTPSPSLGRRVVVNPSQRRRTAPANASINLQKKVSQQLELNSLKVAEERSTPPRIPGSPKVSVLIEQRRARLAAESAKNNATDLLPGQRSDDLQDDVQNDLPSALPVSLQAVRKSPEPRPVDQTATPAHSSSSDGVRPTGLIVSDPDDEM